jgi:hypothetical protein
MELTDFGEPKFKTLDAFLNHDQESSEVTMFNQDLDYRPKGSVSSTHQQFIREAKLFSKVK